MENTEDVLIDTNTVWEAEQETKRELEFGYEFLIEALGDVISEFSGNKMVSGGVMIGQLLQIIIENKKYFNEE